jgi:hypothetical protein
MTVTTDVGRVGSGEGTVVSAGLIPAPVGLVQPAKSAQSTSPEKASITRDFCILSAFIFVYFFFCARKFREIV